MSFDGNRKNIGKECPSMRCLQDPFESLPPARVETTSDVPALKSEPVEFSLRLTNSSLLECRELFDSLAVIYVFCVFVGLYQR